MGKKLFTDFVIPIETSANIEYGKISAQKPSHELSSSTRTMSDKIATIKHRFAK